MHHLAGIATSYKANLPPELAARLVPVNTELGTFVDSGVS